MRIRKRFVPIVATGLVTITVIAVALNRGFQGQRPPTCFSLSPQPVRGLFFSMFDQYARQCNCQS